jgi:hypothetical protein
MKELQIWKHDSLIKSISVSSKKEALEEKTRYLGVQLKHEENKAKDYLFIYFVRQTL